MINTDLPDGYYKKYIDCFVEVKMYEGPAPDCDFCTGFV